MKSKRNVIIIATVILLVVVSGIFLSTKLISFAGNYQRSIYDDNSKIISQSDSYSFLINHSDIDGDTLTDEFKKFTGMYTIYDIKADNDATIKIDFNTDISDGKFKIVLIDSNDNITDILENSSTVAKEIAIPSGKNRIKMVGYKSKGNIELTVSSEDDVTIRANKD